MNISYIRILQAIEAFSSEHMQVKRFASDFTGQLPNFGTSDEAYPILYVSPDITTYNEYTNTFTITVYCFDVIQKDRANINTILSDTNLILTDLFLWLKDGEIAGIDVTTNTADLTPINNSLLDYVAGWSMSIDLEVDRHSVCEIPFANQPIVINECNDIIYDSVLTCNGLADCETFQDLEERVTVLEGLTGSTGGGQTENFVWKFSTSTLSGDPASGYFRLNNANPNLATEIYIDSLTDNGVDIDNLFSTIQGNWNIYFQDTNDSTKFVHFSSVANNYVNNSGWWKLPVTVIQVGSGGLPSNNQKCAFLFINKNGGTVTTDVYVTGGTHNLNTGISTFTNNTGGTFNVTGYLTPQIDVFTTGGTFTDTHNVTFTNNTGGTFNVGGFVNTAQTATVNGLTQNLVADDREWITSQACTGVIAFSGSPKGIVGSGTTMINISPMKLVFVDNESVPGYSNPQILNFTGATGVTVTTLTGGTSSYVSITPSGSILFQNTFPTSGERKVNVWLGKIGHPSGLITTVINEPDYSLSPLSQFRDMYQALNYINDGVYPVASNANLTFSITEGNIHGNGINLHNSNTMPNEINMGPFNPATFLYRTQTGGTFTATTLIDPANYEVGGVLTPVGGGANSSTLQYIFAIPGIGFIVQYGQTVYSNLPNAIAAIGSESFAVFPNLVKNSILIGVLAVNKNATDLTDTSKARFFRADIFGQTIGAVGGTSTGSLQTAYNNSLQPQIVTNSTLGALQVKGYDNGLPAFEVLSSGGTSLVTINDLGTVSAQTFVKSGGTNYQILMASGGSKERHYVTQTTYALASGTTALQKMGDWGSSGNGSFILKSGTSYSVTMSFAIESLGASNTTVNLGFLGDSGSEWATTTLASKVGTVGNPNAANINLSTAIIAGFSIGLTPVGTAANLRTSNYGYLTTGSALSAYTFIPAVALGAATPTAVLKALVIEINELGQTATGGNLV